jgi:amino acid transporter
LRRAPPAPDRLSTLGLTAATFFIVSGGPYGVEEIVLGYGYAGAVALLALVPIVWSLPVALMVGELGSALPATGGYYVWVRRALGSFWGLQEAWLSLAVGIVDIAIYPTLLIAYLGRLWPGLEGEAIGRPGWCVAMAAIAACACWNALGIRSVGRGSAGLAALLLLPFAAMLVLSAWALPSGGLEAARAAFAGRPPADAGALAGGLMLAMWNLMGFDNASTFAGEVRDPSGSYPRAMILTATVVAATYVATVLAAAVTGMPPAAWTSGSWVDVGRSLGGTALAAAVTAGGAISAVGMYNALLLSWSRLPVTLADDGWLPAGFALRSARTHAPVRAVLLGGVLSALCVGLGLRRLVEIDVLLYGGGLALELIALVVLRVREPSLARPFRIPGGPAACAVVALPPLALLGVAAWRGRAEPALLGLSAVGLTLLIASIGPLWWGVVNGARRRRAAVQAGPPAPGGPASAPR